MRAVNSGGVKIGPACGDMLVGPDQIDGAWYCSQIPGLQGAAGIVFGMQTQDRYCRVDVAAQGGGGCINAQQRKVVAQILQKIAIRQPYIWAGRTGAATSGAAHRVWACQWRGVIETRQAETAGIDQRSGERILLGQREHSIAKHAAGM